MFRNSLGIVRTFKLYWPRLVAKHLLRAKPVKLPANPEDFVNAKFLADTIGGASLGRWKSVLRKHHELRALTRKNVKNTVEMLSNLQFTANDILSIPNILNFNKATIENRHQVLRESGFDLISISILFKFVTVMNKPVAMLKAYNYIPPSTDIVERLKENFTDFPLDITIETNNTDIELKTVRQKILNSYLRKRLDFSDADIVKVWKCYQRIRHKSFRSVHRMVKLLLEEVKFQKERIINNGYILHGDPDNLQRILDEIRSIGGQDVRDLLRKRPKLMMCNCDAMLKTIENIKLYGIDEDCILRCLEVLTLGADTVSERLKDLRSIAEFEVFSTNPRVLHLVHYHRKARLRLEYLNQFNIRCTSIYILSCGTVPFVRFARDGGIIGKGRAIVIYLSKVLNKDENDIRKQISRHPHWCHLAILQIKQCYDFLISQGFTNDDIYRNIPLLLYSVERIKEKELVFRQPDFYKRHNINTNYAQLTKSDSLKLIIYLIESDFHFTGDGVWNQQPAQQVDSARNQMPSCLQTVKATAQYGVKHTTSKATNNKTQLQNC